MSDKRKILMALENLMNKIARENNCQFKKLLEQLDVNITPGQYFILKGIEMGRDCKAADIAHKLDISPAATTNVLDRLCQSGLIERIRSEKDRRIVWLKLTDAGQRRLKAIDDKKIDVLMEQFKNVTDEELTTVIKVFEKVLLK
jgi:DNA-binding MarR family transcriptional regulator